MRLPDRVSVLRGAVVTGSYGGADIDWSAPAVTVYPAVVQPVSSTEEVAAQQRTVTRWRLFLPPSADLRATDRVSWDGAQYEVDGDVQAWKRGGVPHHVEALLTRVSGG